MFYALLLLAVGVFAISPTHAATFTVNSLLDLNDADPADGVCDISLLLPGLQCTLRAAMTQANATPGPHTIDVGGIGIIFVNSDLPPLTSDSITIQGGITAGNPSVTLLPGLLSTATTGIHIQSDNNTIHNLAIIGFDDYGIQVRGENNSITGNFIGTANGTTAAPNGIGIGLFNGANNNRIGGSTPGQGNVISGNTRIGIHLHDPAACADSPMMLNIIEGNYIGIQADATDVLPNEHGIVIQPCAVGNTIGAGNVISGNTLTGITIDGTDTSSASLEILANRNRIIGNLIGTDPTGTLPNFGNGTDGIVVTNGAHAVSIANNVISSNNGNGISLLGTDARSYVHGNFIGTNASSDALGNGGHGILLGDDASENIIGQRENGAGTTNIIAYNGGDGVRVGTSAAAVNNNGNSIRGNFIYQNSGLGIDLGGDGVSLNDTDDTDTGPNRLLNYPVIGNIALDGAEMVLDIDLQVAPPLAGFYDEYKTHEIHFYANSVCDASGHGEGQRYIGTIAVDVDVNGVYSEQDYRLPNSVTTTDFITATTSRKYYDPTNPIPPPPDAPFDSRQYETSEFSPCEPIGSPVDLEISKLASPTTPGYGTTFTYLLTVTNHGPVDATNVHVVDNLPAAVTFVSASPGCTLTGYTVSCIIPALMANRSTVVFIRVIAPDAAATLTNVGFVSADQPDFQQANNTAANTITFAPATSVPVPTNTQPTLPTASSTSVSTVQTPTHTQIPPSSTPLPTDTAIPPSATPLPTNTFIPPSATPLPATSTPSLPTVTPTSIRLATSVLPTAGTPAQEPEQIIIQKSVEAVGDDDTIGIGITVSNTSQQALSGVTVIEELFAGTVIVESHTINPTCTKNAASIACNLGTLLSGTSAQVNFVVEAGGVNPLLGRTIVRSDALPDVVLDEPYIVKWAAPPFAIPGEEVTWTIYVINPGSDPVRNVVVQDSIPESLTILGAEATRGSVSISGQNVTLRLASLDVVEAVTLTIRTRVERDTRLDPVVMNNACLTTAQQPDAICIQAPVFRIDQLPSTGESPWWRAFIIVAGVPVLFGGVWLLVKRLYTVMVQSPP